MYKKISYIFIVILISILVFVIYTANADNSNNQIKEKVSSEIKYFESKLIYMFNSLNNIEFENYDISTEDVTEKTKQSSSNSNNSGEENQDSSDSQESQDSTSQNNTSKKYSLNVQGVLSSKKEINWDHIKNEAELLEDSISTITLDLYEIEINKDDILNFNKEYDDLLIAIKNENKANTLIELSNIYSYIPKFIKKYNTSEQYEIVINTKNNILNAYALLDTDNWDEINKYLNKASNTYSKLLTNINNNNNNNQFIVNKCYVSINNLQNAVKNKDKEIFLIKYKNLLEDLNNL